MNDNKCPQLKSNSKFLCKNIFSVIRDSDKTELEKLNLIYSLTSIFEENI